MRRFDSDGWHFSRNPYPETDRFNLESPHDRRNHHGSTPPPSVRIEHARHAERVRLCRGSDG